MKNVSRRNFIAGGTVAAIGSALALAGCTPSKSSEGSSEGASSNGTGIATAQAMGKHGNMDIEVSAKDGAIDRITVLSSRETPGLGDHAMEQLTKQIIDSQTLNVDTVSGATLSSMAFISAVGQALDAIGEDSSDWQGRDKAASEAEPLPESADVVVVGAGGAGFAAAISAANKGANVVLLEKMGVYGGDTALSGGEMAAPGNWIQAQEGIKDSPDNLAEDMLVGGDNKADPELVQVIAEGALDSSQWLTFEAGVSWKHDLMQFGGHNIKRSIIPITHSGSEMTTKLTRRVGEIDNIALFNNSQATELVKDGDAVTGVKVKNTLTGEESTISCKAVVLTAGGFGSNVEMRVKYNPDMDDKILSTDSVGATGDGIVMGEAAGADLVDMEYIQTYPVCDPENGSLLYVGDVRLEYQGLLVNKEGQRFVEELDRRDVISNAITEQTDSIAYVLFNQAGADKTGLLEVHSDEYENCESRGVVVKGDTIDEVCEAMGVDAEGLKATIEAWNGYCKDGKDPEWNYRGEMNPIEDGPYYLLACKPAVHYTMGGLRINTSAEVLDKNKQPIAGLFAAGEVAGHKMGTNRLGSCSMSDIYTFGRIAGENAAAYTA
ncbi:flavocytochrome c [Slackia equolifaciens]|uniref:Urocanate reductase n=1 Tax=Slackia equolifaciens TaxID=498718 RepID=A0A3N0B1J4_9ACTN|nr:flavocytochrome c [Slackia equolifaciens]RNL40818.1 flavocytochrome c [Slackia equolifaciens]